MSRNFMQSIRELSIDGYHPSGVMRSPLLGRSPLKIKVKIQNLQGDNAPPLKETFADLLG